MPYIHKQNITFCTLCNNFKDHGKVLSAIMQNTSANPYTISY